MLNQQELTQTELFVLHQNLVKLLLVSNFFLQFELLFLSLHKKVHVSKVVYIDLEILTFSSFIRLLVLT